MFRSVEIPRETETRPLKGRIPGLQTMVPKSKIPLLTGKNQRLPGEMADSQARVGDARVSWDHGRRRQAARAGCTKVPGPI